MTDHITVIGNIATEPEQRRTTAGVVVTSFRVASSQRHFDSRTGEWVDGNTNWYRVSAFRALGENAFASLAKGQRVVVTGKLRVKEWESGGKKGIEVEIDADGLGHDLMWGTTSFQRVPRGEARAADSQAARSTSAGDGETGAAMDAAASAPAGSADATERAGQADDAWALSGASTPF